jgi:hypothetical protein
MSTSPPPSPDSEAEQVVDELPLEFVVVQVGSPPFLKCGLLASAALAVIPHASNAASTITVRFIGTMCRIFDPLSDHWPKALPSPE